MTPIPDQDVTDRFGARLPGELKAAMVRTPATAGTGFCGDGTIDPGEQCEIGDLGGVTWVASFSLGGVASGAKSTQLLAVRAVRDAAPCDAASRPRPTRMLGRDRWIAA